MAPICNGLIAFVIVHFISMLSMATSSGTPAASSPIFEALEKKDMARMEYLLGNEGVNPDYVDPASKSGWTPLIYASSHGMQEFVERLILAGADPNHVESDGWTPLHFAAVNGYVVVARDLLEAGADPKLKNKKGKTAADLAKDFKKFGVLEMLETAKIVVKPPPVSQQLARGGVSERDEEGHTALHRASHFCELEQVRSEVRKGAMINAADNNGWTALMEAAATGCSSVVEFLLNAGADPTEQSLKGKTAAVIAREKGHKEVMMMHLYHDDPLHKHDMCFFVYCISCPWPSRRRVWRWASRWATRTSS